MDLVLLIVLVVGALVAWTRIDDLARRVQAADEQVARLQGRIAVLEAHVARLARPGTQESGPAVPAPSAPEPPLGAPSTAAAMPAAPAPGAPGWSSARPPQRPARGAAERASAAARTARDEGPSTIDQVLKGPGGRRVDVPPAARPEPAPAGPGLLDRTLAALGFTPPEAGGTWSKATVESWLEGRMLAVVGGLALVLGAIFFLSLAFSRGWITEEMRVLIGLGAGAGLLVLGEVAFARLQGIVGHVLVAIGLAILSLAFFAATRLYALVPVEMGLAGAFAAAAVVAVIAIRHDSQLVAAFGLVTVLAAPPLLGASPTLVTLLFVGAALAGATGVALFRTWVWLPPLAFILSAPQLASWIVAPPPVGEGLVAVAAFWLVNIVAAGGEETRRRTDRLRTTTVTLLLADAAFTVWAGFTILSGELEPWRGAFLAGGALLHLALSVFFLVRYGDRHPFGLVVAATGVAALTMAVPVRFGGPPVPIAWAAEAVALAWVAVLRRHPYSAALAVLLGGMALGHLLAVEYPPASLVDGYVRSIPFVGPEGMTFAFMAGALLVAGLVVPIAWVRALLGAVGVLVTSYVAPAELSGPALVAAWAALAGAGLVLHERVLARWIRRGFVETRVAALGLPAFAEPAADVAIRALSRATRPIFVVPVVLAALAALGHLGTFDYPLLGIADPTTPDVPFANLSGLAFGIVLLAIAAAALLVTASWLRVALAALGGMVALYVFPFELSGPALVAAWAALGAVAFAVEVLIVEPRVGPAFAGAVVPYIRPSLRAVGALALAAALGHLLVLDFPPDAFTRRTLSTIPYVGPEGISLGATLAALGAAAWILRLRWARLGAIGIGAALLAYTVTFEVGQPAVTIAWGALAVGSLAVVRRVAPVDPLAIGKSALEAAGEGSPFAASGLALAFLIGRATWIADPSSFARHVLGDVALTGTPFGDERTFVLGVLALTVLALAATWRGETARVIGAAAAVVAVAWLLPFEMRPAYAVAGWAGLAVIGLWLARVPAARSLLGGESLALIAFGAVVALAVVAPPDRLVVDSSTQVLGLGIVTDATVALGGLGIALAAAAFLHRSDRLAMWGLAAAGVVAVYLLSVAVADSFQSQVGTRPLEELEKEGQVGLTVLWSILGGSTFAAGLLSRRPPVRIFGLALLGLATAKVFLVDLAALDVAYRVLSLVALGVLLLMSAAAYSRIQHPRGPVSPTGA